MLLPLLMRLMLSLSGSRRGTVVRATVLSATVRSAAVRSAAVVSAAVVSAAAVVVVVRRPPTVVRIAPGVSPAAPTSLAHPSLSRKPAALESGLLRPARASPVQRRGLIPPRQQHPGRRSAATNNHSTTIGIQRPQGRHEGHERQQKGDQRTDHAGLLLEARVDEIPFPPALFGGVGENHARRETAKSEVRRDVLLVLELHVRSGVQRENWGEWRT